MSSPVHTIGSDRTADEAVALLRRYRIRHLPVIDRAELVGVVTDRDLRGVEADVPVGAVMSWPVVSVTQTTPIDEAARILFDRRIGCLPVLQETKLVGILTQTDALAALVDLLRSRVGGRNAELAVAYRPDAIPLAHATIRGLGSEVAHLVMASLGPVGAGGTPERVRLEVETRELATVIGALRLAGLEVLSAPGGESPP
jgi:acetoin utilization protein AcuB